MSEIVLLKQYDAASFPGLKNVNVKEVKRYAGIIGGSQDNSDPAGDMNDLLESCIKESLPVFTYNVSYLRTKISWENEMPVLPFDIKGSKNLAENLTGCCEIVMFAATVGSGIDRLIARYGRVQKSKALFMQTIGAERVEALCDTFNDEINEIVKSEGGFTRPRFSPGYGDLPITVQKDFMRILDCQRKLGVTLSDSFLMSPSKSVTAIIGIGYGEDSEKNEKHTGCSLCKKTDCEYRKI